MSVANEYRVTFLIFTFFLTIILLFSLTTYGKESRPELRLSLHSCRKKFLAQRSENFF